MVPTSAEVRSSSVGAAVSRSRASTPGPIGRPRSAATAAATARLALRTTLRSSGPAGGTVSRRMRSKVQPSGGRGARKRGAGGPAPRDGVWGARRLIATWRPSTVSTTQLAPIGVAVARARAAATWTRCRAIAIPIASSGICRSTRFSTTARSPTSRAVTRSANTGSWSDRPVTATAPVSGSSATGSPSIESSRTASS